VNERRQRAVRALIASASALAILVISGGCEARSSIEAAQTAVSVGQTALPGLQTALPGFQTALPGLQATAQAGATLVGAVLSDPQAVNAQLQAILAGATVEVKTTPEAVANDSVTNVIVTATDAQGTFAQEDPRSRQATSTGALLLLGQYFSKATISLSVVDTAGATLISGTKAPGQAPSVQ
jgi:hypothetical protein